MAHQHGQRGSETVSLPIRDVNGTVKLSEKENNCELSYDNLERTSCKHRGSKDDRKSQEKFKIVLTSGQKNPFSLIFLAFSFISTL